jgi:putative DNA primase/helicase
MAVDAAVVRQLDEARNRTGAASPANEDSVVPPDCTDEALALQFSTDHAAELRHVSVWGKWMEWDGTRWKPDATLNTFNRARIICRRASSQCENAKVAAKVASASTVAAVERLAKADRRHAATVDQWDANPWLLNTPGGTVDLKTGKMRPHNPADHMTKMTAVAPGGECPMWRKFLAKVTNGDTAVQDYLKRMAGYALTGSIREHALFFFFGTGANGKGVTINTMTGIMADYACVAGIETFTASTSDRHPTDLAMLRGARLVTAQETEEGRRWAESRIKAMTGGDPITARFMRQDFFTFEPTFKLLIAGNHRPGLRNVDEAIRRRFNLVPFAVKIPPSERDLDLPEKLKAEWPGILKWAIEGCLEWQKIGLAAPAAVIEATAEYLNAEDATAGWLEECCIVGGTSHSGSSVLFASWKAWAEAAGEYAGSQKGFSQKLVSAGFERKKLPNCSAGFVGIGLKPPVTPAGQSNRQGERDDPLEDAPY